LEIRGGDLAVWSELNSGTEVELVVPAMIAYQTRSATRTSWFSRKKGWSRARRWSTSRVGCGAGLVWVGCWTSTSAPR